ncbi:MAG: helix-turn-helix transcriptional regulator [Oscillospiraceae bacterium]|nr:helix-turn-helix transcriptional regulator [Oscillospiraceae bacterium]
MLHETIAALRRGRGLSQEQLAEALGVSRQSVSKWETGQATPELDRLRAMCAFFGVTLDQLTGEAPLKTPPAADPPGRAGVKLGAALCLLGTLCLLLYGILLLASPEAAAQLDGSVTLRGTGLLIAGCFALLGAGAALLRRKK